MTPTRHMTMADLAGLRWRGYLRESSERQAEMWSPERQRADMTRAAAEAGMVPVEPVFYERTGTGEVESPELERALADGRAKAYDVLVVLTTSRFARNRDEAVRRKAQFAKAGIPIFFVQDRILSGARSSRLLEGVREVMDEEENEQRRYFIAGGMRERQLAGQFIGRIPFGYRRRMADFPDGTRRWDGGLEVEPTEAPGVRLAFDRWLAGDTYRRIVLLLNAANYRSRMGELWTTRAVKVLLANPIYTGRLVRYRRSHPDHYFPEADAQDGRRDIGRPFPALVSDEVFEAGRAIAARKPQWTGPQRFDYPLSGTLRCAACGRRMTGASSSRRYYRCVGRTEVGDCEAPLAQADRVEADVAHWLSDLRLPADWRTEIARLEVRDQSHDDGQRKMAVEERLRRLRDLYAWGDLDETTYRAQSAELRSELAVGVVPSVTNLVAIAEALRDIGARFGSADASPSAKRAVTALLFREVTVAQGRVSAFNLRAEVRPIIDLCRVLADPCPLSTHPQYTIAYSA